MNREMLMLIDAISREKSVERDVVFGAVEAALAQATKKLDLATGEGLVWSAAPRGFVSEPLMVPRPGATAEDDGWVLCLVWNGARCASDLVILDAASMAEVAVLELPLAVPHGLHGSFAPA